METKDLIPYVGEITNYTVFEEDISSYNVFQLAAWIRKCRTSCDKRLADEELKHIYAKYRKETLERMGIENPTTASGYCVSFEVFKRSYDDFYLVSMALFVGEWMEHFQQRKGVYESREYKQAVLYLSLPATTYNLCLPNGDKIPCTDLIQEFLYNDMKNYCSIAKSVNKIESKRISEYSKAIDTMLDEKSTKTSLPKLLVEFSATQTIIDIFVMSKKDVHDLLSTKDVKEFLEELRRFECQKKNTSFVIETSGSFTTFIQNILPKHHINKNTYYEYVDTKGNGKRVIRKDFFENLAFFLGFTLGNVEKLLLAEGYSIAESIRFDDVLMASCYRCGFPQWLANEYLESWGCNRISISGREKKNVTQKDG